MSFRRDAKSRGRLWLKAHRSVLAEAGVPASLLDNEEAWTYLVLHGDDPYQSGWDAAWLTDAQAVRLLRVLRGSPFDSVGHDLFAVLDRRVQSKPKKGSRR